MGERVELVLGSMSPVPSGRSLVSLSPHNTAPGKVTSWVTWPAAPPDFLRQLQGGRPQGRVLVPWGFCI